MKYHSAIPTILRRRFFRIGGWGVLLLLSSVSTTTTAADALSTGTIVTTRRRGTGSDRCPSPGRGGDGSDGRRRRSSSSSPSFRSSAAVERSSSAVVAARRPESAAEHPNDDDNNSNTTIEIDSHNGHNHNNSKTNDGGENHSSTVNDGAPTVGNLKKNKSSSSSSSDTCSGSSSSSSSSSQARRTLIASGASGGAASLALLAVTPWTVRRPAPPEAIAAAAAADDWGGPYKNRRAAVATADRAATTGSGEDDADDVVGESVTVPLEYVPRLSAYVLYYNVGGERFVAILDTGSPFLTVPNYCDRNKWMGCYSSQTVMSRPSGLEPTIEMFDNNEGSVEWRAGPFSFVNATGSMRGPNEVVFGVLSDRLLAGSGGVFFGLIRDADPRIRPSFLGQTNVRAFEIDLRHYNNNMNDNNMNDDNNMNNKNNINSSNGDDANDNDNKNDVAGHSKTLTLRTRSFRSSDMDYIPLVRDLHDRFGDPVVHYAARASAIWANGQPVVPLGDPKPVYAIFDTGVSGMVVSDELFEQRYRTARRNREKSLWGRVQVVFRTRRGETVSLEATKPITTPLGDVPWPRFRPNSAHIIVLGLSFLDGRKTSIDIDQRRIMIE